MKILNRKTAGIAEQERPVKVLQFGEGNFLRGFVDWIIDVLNEKTNFNGNVFVIQPIETGMVNLLNEQDGLYHLLLNGIQNGEEINEKRLITSVTGGLDPHTDYHGFLKLAENAELKFIISNTTESGIEFKESDSNPEEILPSGFPGKVTSFLYHRFLFFDGDPETGLVLIPCELIERNGEALKEMVLKYAEHFNLPTEFTNWVEEHNYFCNTLVDRIVPGFPRENILEIQKDLGYEDKLVVKAEPFHLWVIEGPDFLKKWFPAHKADLEVKFVDDLTPYRTRKVRILNGAHTAIVPVGYLKGLRTVRETVEDNETGVFLKNVIFEEIVPTLDLPAKELDKFAKDVLERFQNPSIRHELISIALNSVSKFKVRVLPSILEYINRKKSLPENLLFSLAALIVFYKGEWKGEEIPLNDSKEAISFFKHAWSKNEVEKTVELVLSNKEFWETDLARIDGLSNLVTKQVESLLQEESVNQKP